MMIDLRPGSRRRGIEPSGAPCEVVLVIPANAPASEAGVTLAREQAGAGTVAVVLVLPVHGYALGLPNPGLLPNARERAAADRAMQGTLHALERLGLDADGEIVVTRNARRAVVRIATRRTAPVVLVDLPAVSRIRQLLEGDLVSQLTRRLSSATKITRVERSAAGP